MREYIFLTQTISYDFNDNEVGHANNTSETADECNFILRDFQDKLKSLIIKNYSKDINHIMIMIVSQADWMPKQYQEQFFPEVRRIIWAKKNADYRLKIDFNKLQKATDVAKRKMFLDVIVEAVEDIGIHAKEKKKHFDGKKLLADIMRILE
ncbi:MAG: immunity 44 family protein [Bacteroidales bacterium]|nr:immunity 44 family protein [Bacteroidales bacterium]